MPTTTEPEVRASSIESDRAHYRLYLPADLVYFIGHFPDQPILPGVVQLRWAIALAQPLGLGEDLDAMQRLKFSRPMVPGLELELQLQQGPGSLLMFRYYDSDGDYSSGRLQPLAITP